MADTVLAEVIRQRGSRQTYLAECAGVSPSHLNRALKLERPLSAEAVEIIAGRLGVPVIDVYDGQRLRARTDDSQPVNNAPSGSHGQQPGVKNGESDSVADRAENGTPAASQSQIGEPA